MRSQKPTVTPSTPSLRNVPKVSFQTALISLNVQAMVTDHSKEEVGGGINRLYRAGANAEAEELAELGDEDLNQPQVVQRTDRSVEKYQLRH